MAYTQIWKEVLEQFRDFVQSESIMDEGEVTSVSADKSTVEVMPFGSNVPIMVQLRAGQGDKGFAVIPAVGSRVVFASLDAMNSGLLIMADKVSEVVIDGKTILNADVAITGETVINKGTNGGLLIGPKVLAELVKLNVQVEAILGLPVALQAAGAVAVTPFEIALVAAITSLGSLPKPSFSAALLNDKVKH
jgi:hypothetical protein